MCLAIYKPARAVIPTEHLFNGYECNDNGCGFAYSEKGKLFIVKGLFSFADFLKQYKEKEEYPMLIHFRFATHGDTNVLNCHPFNILDGQYALIHNGVLPIHCTIKGLSDTGNFSKLVMEPMLKNGIYPSKPAFRFLVEQSIGHGNRIALMSAKGDVVIYNEDDGETEDAVDAEGKPVTSLIKKGNKIERIEEKVWYSNGCYKSLTRRRRVSSHQDEYEGFFDGGTSDADVAVNSANGFEGAPKNEINPNFCNRAKLDSPPQGTIEGFKAGIKSAEDSALTIQKAYSSRVEKDGVVTRTEKDGKINVVHTTNQTPQIDDHTITVIEKGPIFSAKEELEIHFLMKDMNITREAAIDVLQLELSDAITYIE